MPPSNQMLCDISSLLLLSMQFVIFLIYVDNTLQVNFQAILTHSTLFKVYSLLGLEMNTPCSKALPIGFTLHPQGVYTNTYPCQQLKALMTNGLAVDVPRISVFVTAVLLVKQQRPSKPGGERQSCVEICVFHMTSSLSPARRPQSEVSDLNISKSGYRLLLWSLSVTAVCRRKRCLCDEE